MSGTGETLAEVLRHIDARLTLSADIDPESVTLEQNQRATHLRARIRQTLEELELQK